MRKIQCVHARVLRGGRIHLKSDGKAPVLKLEPALVALISLALAKFGSPGAAARRLGVSLRDLQTRLRQYGLTEAAR